MADDFQAVLGSASTFRPQGAKANEQLAAALEEMERRLEVINRTIATDLGRKVVNAGQIIEARAKEILTEKGHIVTGALRRSINTQPRLGPGTIAALVGSPLDYAPAVEDLPDGGYLNEAAEQRFDLATEFLVSESVDPTLEKWRTG